MNGARQRARRAAKWRASCSSRPEVRNAFNAELIADLHDAFAHPRGRSHRKRSAQLSWREGAAFWLAADAAWMRASVALSVQDNEALCMSHGRRARA